MQQKDKEGMTALTLAEKNGHRKCLDYLKIAASKVFYVMNLFEIFITTGRKDDLMFSVLDSGFKGVGFETWADQCVVFWLKHFTITVSLSNQVY